MKGNNKLIAKKITALLLCSLIVSPAFSSAITAEAVQVKDEESRASGTFFFDSGDWNSQNILFYVWDGDTGECATKTGWTDSNVWGSKKKIAGTPVEGKAGVYESYEIDFAGREDHELYVIFHDKDTNEQTFDCLINETAIGKTASRTGNKLENPIDSTKKTDEALFDGGTDLGPAKVITSSGKIQGKVISKNADRAGVVADFVYNNLGSATIDGEEIVTKDSVANAIKEFDTTADDVWAKYQTYSDRELYNEDEAKAVIFGSQEVITTDINTDTHTDTETETDTETNTDTHTDTDTETDTYSETDTETDTDTDTDTNTDPELPEFEYSKLADGTCGLSGYNGAASELDVPYKYGSNDVTAIMTDAFKDNSTLSIVVLPDTVTTIQKSAFNHCSSLLTVYIPETVVNIDDEAFTDCGFFTIAGKYDSYAERYASEHGILFVPDEARYYHRFTYKVLSDNTVEITDYKGAGAFVRIPDEIEGRTVTSIADKVFASCLIVEVTIPSTVTNIAPNALIGIDNSKCVINTYPGAPAVTFAEENNYEYYLLKTPEYYNDFEYTTTSNGTVEITYYKGTLPEPKIPEKINGLKVTSIGSNAFKDNTDITSITIPDSVTSIGDYAFNNCVSLESIQLPYALTTIGDYAIGDCWKLESIKLPDTVDYLGLAVFAGDVKLSSINIPSSLKRIEMYDFYYCQSLESLTIPRSVVFIDNTAFSECPLLTLSVYSNSNAESFAKKNNVPYVLIEPSTDDTDTDTSTDTETDTDKSTDTDTDTNTDTDTDTNTDTDTDTNKRIYEYKQTGDNTVEITEYKGDEKEVIIPETLDGKTVAAIGDSAFRDNVNITKVQLPTTVKTISSFAFQNCASLSNIIIPRSVASISENAFAGTPWFENNHDEFFIAGSNILIAYHGSGGTVTIPDTVQSINNSVFSGQSEIKELTIPSSVTAIGDNAFYGCAGLKKLSLPNSVTSIGSSAFAECETIKTVTLPDSIKTIGKNAFYKCIGLESITLPNSLTSIENNTFNGCKHLMSIIIPETVTSIGDNAFDNTNLSSVTIPKNVTSVGEFAFQNCYKLKTVTILNPEAELSRGIFRASGKITIEGYKNSTAEAYASKDSNLSFKDISSSDTPKTDDPKTDDPKQPTQPKTIGTYGEIDGDGSITSADSLLILRRSVQLENFTENQNKLSDVDGDGSISSADALEVLRHSVKLPSQTSVGKTLTE